MTGPQKTYHPNTVHWKTRENELGSTGDIYIKYADEYI